MPPTGLLDDETIEAIVAGDEVDARFDQLVAFAWHVRTLGDEPPPPPSRALEAVFAGLDGERPRSGAGRRRLAGVAAKVAGLGLAAQVGLGASVAAAGVIAAGAGGVLPGPATNGVRSAIEAVTPIDFGGSGASDEPARRDDQDRFGDRVSSDATGESDGNPGVDGGEISDEAPGAAHRPDRTGTTENPGLDRAGETPAAPNLPDQPGSGSGSAGGSDTDDQPSGVEDTPGATAPDATAPGATAPGRTVQDPAATPSSTIPPSAPAGTATTGRAGGGGNSTAQGG